MQKQKQVDEKLCAMQQNEATEKLSRHTCKSIQSGDNDDNNNELNEKREHKERATKPPE